MPSVDAASAHATLMSRLDAKPASPRRAWKFSRPAHERSPYTSEHYHRAHGIAVAVLRIGALLSEDTTIDKYGNREERAGDNYVDPRDVGETARLCLGLPDLTFETLFVMGVPASAARYDTAWTEWRLGWTPKHHHGR